MFLEHGALAKILIDHPSSWTAVTSTVSDYGSHHPLISGSPKRPTRRPGDCLSLYNMGQPRGVLFAGQRSKRLDQRGRLHHSRIQACHPPEQERPSTPSALALLGRTPHADRVVESPSTPDLLPSPCHPGWSHVQTVSSKCVTKATPAATTPQGAAPESDIRTSCATN